MLCVVMPARWLVAVTQTGVQICCGLVTVCSEHLAPFPIPHIPLATPPPPPTVLGYTDKANQYLPPYNWWADSAAQHLIDVVNKYYQGTGFSFYVQQVRAQQSRVSDTESAGSTCCGAGRCVCAHPGGG